MKQYVGHVPALRLFYKVSNNKKTGIQCPMDQNNRIKYKLSTLQHVNQSIVQLDIMAALYAFAFTFLAVTLLGEGFGLSDE